MGKIVLPRALLNGAAPLVRAETNDPKELFRQLREGIEGSRREHNERLPTWKPR